MKKLLCLFTLLLLCIPLSRGAELSDTLSVRRVFADVRSEAFDILSRSTRLDMIDYAAAGSDYEAVNEMYSHSSITSFSDSCISVGITEVSSAQVFTLPTPRCGVAALIYTVDTGGVADSQISFYDSALRPLKTDKHFKAPRLRDFLSPQHRADKQSVATLEDMVPFTAMRYDYEPQTLRLRVTLCLHSLLSQEDLKQLAPLLPAQTDPQADPQADPQSDPQSDPALTYRWTGTRFQLIN